MLFYSFKNKLVCLVTSLVLVGCAATNSLLGGNSRKDAIAETEWAFAKNEVIIDVKSSERLNAYNGEAHTLVIGMFQMSDAAAFYKLTSDVSSMSEALEFGKGKDQFLQLVRFVVSPGKCMRFMLDRVQNAKYVGIITGYYVLDQQNSWRIFPISIDISRRGLISRTFKAKPIKLMIKMELGAEGIVQAQSVNQETSVSAHCLNEPNRNNVTDKLLECCDYTIQYVQDKIVD
ncbi:MAG: hypothetical protein K0R08_74 [Solimicrobium sp.]|jgi:type VI secretion system VasD/TssJ family lipoprotein|nr:hypothetical protein [Solimicrobium sp.]